MDSLRLGLICRISSRVSDTAMMVFGTYGDVHKPHLEIFCIVFHIVKIITVNNTIHARHS